MMRVVTAHIQLLFSWLILWLATLSLSLLQHSAEFFGLPRRKSGSAVDELDTTSNNLFVFGSLVVAEIGVFLALLIIAVLLIYFCKKNPTRHR